MGTNYYVRDTFPSPAPAEADLHIGKSSAGWVFALHVIPEEGLLSLADWEKFWSEPGREIRSEYEEVLTPEEMRAIILERSWERKTPRSVDFHKTNYSEDGPNGLVRYRLNAPGCAGHGEGTWDLIEGEFS